MRKVKEKRARFKTPLGTHIHTQMHTWVSVSVCVRVCGLSAMLQPLE